MTREIHPAETGWYLQKEAADGYRSADAGGIRCVSTNDWIGCFSK